MENHVASHGFGRADDALGLADVGIDWGIDWDGRRVLSRVPVVWAGWPWIRRGTCPAPPGRLNDR
jgi:hypothetical protein